MRCCLKQEHVWPTHRAKKQNGKPEKNSWKKQGIDSGFTSQILRLLMLLNCQKFIVWVPLWIIASEYKQILLFGTLFIPLLLYTHIKTFIKTRMQCTIFSFVWFFSDVWLLCRKEENCGQQGLSKYSLN